MNKILSHILLTLFCFVYACTLSAQNLGITTPATTNYPSTSLGDATLESGTGNRGANNIEAWDKFTTTVPLTVTNFFMYQNATGATGTMHIGLYKDASGPGSLVTVSDGGAITLSASSGWINYNVNPFYLAPGTYWIAFTFSSNLPANWNRKAATATQYYKLGVGYGALPATWPNGSTNITNGPISMYFVGVPIEGYAKATKAILSAIGIFSSVSFYTHAAGNVRLAIFSDNGSGTPSTKQWESGDISINGAGQPKLTTVNISTGTPGSLTLNSGTYWLAWQWNTVTTGPSYRTGGAVNSGNALIQSYGAFPTSWTGGTASTENWTMYATYCAQPTASVTGQTNITCYAANNGTITVAATGGVSPYSFSVDNGINYLPATTGNARLFTGLSPNTAYTIKVKDNVGCVSQ